MEKMEISQFQSIISKPSNCKEFYFNTFLFETLKCLSDFQFKKNVIVSNFKVIFKSITLQFKNC